MHRRESAVRRRWNPRRGETTPSVAEFGENAFARAEGSSGTLIAQCGARRTRSRHSFGEIQMRSKIISAFVASTALTLVVFTPTPSFANTSIYGANVGAVHSNDGTSWCIPALTANGATSSFQFAPSDSTQAKTNNSVDTFARQKVRVLCKPVFGASTIVASPSWSTNAGGDANSATCPGGTTPTMAQCEIDGQIDGGQTTTLPFVYQGSACGTGVSSISTTSSIQGELLYSKPNSPPSSPQTDDQGFPDYVSLPGYPIPSPLAHGPNSGDNTPFIAGADIGGMFLSNDTMNYFFGDSFNNAAGAIWSHGALAKTTNLDPTAMVLSTSGLQSWEMSTHTPATSLFLPQPWTPAQSAATEMTTIPGAGFGVTDASGNSYRFLWYFSVVTFGNPGAFTTNWSSLAYTVNTTLNNSVTWTRGDANPKAPTTPVWPAISNFSPGAVWYDRFNRMIYFFGIRPQLLATVWGTNEYPFSGVRLARVPSTPTSIMNPAKYQYWTGSAWVSDPGNYSVATPQTPAGSGGVYGTGADIIPSAVDPRSEMSVAYDAEAGSFIMMFVNMVDGGIRLYQSPAVTGPWSEVLFDTFSLPNTLDGGSTQSGGQKTYAPFTNDQLLVNGGRDVYYTLSEFTPVYNVGLWHYAITASSPSAMCN
jgi:hypothetical protein